MATKKKPTSTKTKPQVTKGVVGSTLEKPEDEALSGADVVTLRVSLRSPVRFDDIPDGDKKKTITLPGLDEDLRGKRQGILAPDGNAIFFQLPRKDWENLLKMYGDQRMFKSYNGYPAAVAEINSLADAKKGAYKDEIEATKTGFEPVDPSSQNVEETKIE